MKTIYTLLFAFLFAVVTQAQVSVVTENAGYYEVYRDSAGITQFVSQHTKKEKAVEKAVNTAINYPDWNVYYTINARTNVTADISLVPPSNDTTDTTPPDTTDPVQPPVQSGDVNVYAYIATWDYNVGGHGNWGSIRRDEVDWDSFTHGILFASGVGQCSIPEPTAWENISPDRINAFVADAQANGKVAMMSFGGAGNSAGLFYSIENCPVQLAELMSDYMTRWGFQGIDIDAEPTSRVDEAGLIAFAQRFRELQPNAVLVAAINGGESQMAAASEYFDAINYMTYDLSGAWPGWYSWHNAAIYDPNGGTGTNIPGSNTEYPNIHSILADMSSAGIPTDKLGFGVSVDGYDWTGVTAPEQNAANATRTFAPQDITRLTNEYGTDWIMDENAGVSYLSGANTFVSVDNAQTVANKFDYARENGIKHIIWWKYTEYQPIVEEFKRQLNN